MQLNNIQGDINTSIDDIKKYRVFYFLLFGIICLFSSLLIISYLMRDEIVKQDLNFIQFFLSGIIFFFVLCSIYWYLNELPIRIKSTYKYTENTYHLLQSNIDSINEIEEALDIYKLNPSQESRGYDISLYIKKRLLNTELEISENILKDKIKLELFKTSLNTIKNKLLNDLKKENSYIEKLSLEDSEKDNSLIRMSKLSDIVTKRLRTEIAQLSKRSDIYIVFGSGLTIIAGFVLFFTVQGILSTPVTKQEVLSTPLTKQEVSSTSVLEQKELLKSNAKIINDDTLTKHDILSLATRFSIVIFIEVFAFYYFRLYRNIMENIKFYQNEITNIEMKLLALHAAEGKNDLDTLKTLSSELVKTERNFVIDKNKTTIDIERYKQDTNIFTSATENLVKLIKSIK